MGVVILSRSGRFLYSKKEIAVLIGLVALILSVLCTSSQASELYGADRVVDDHIAATSGGWQTLYQDIRDEIINTQADLMLRLEGDQSRFTVGQVEQLVRDGEWDTGHQWLASQLWAQWSWLTGLNTEGLAGSTTLPSSGDSANQALANVIHATHTVLGVGSDWMWLPAMERQWDNRENEAAVRAMLAALVEQMVADVPALKNKVDWVEPPADYCPHEEGIQDSECQECLNERGDVCPHVDGVQTEECQACWTEQGDVCKHEDGVQTSGCQNCWSEEGDLCLHKDGTQTLECQECWDEQGDKCLHHDGVQAGECQKCWDEQGDVCYHAPGAQLEECQECWDEQGDECFHEDGVQDTCPENSGGGGGGCSTTMLGGLVFWLLAVTVLFAGRKRLR